jgi:hypothetical protein
LRREEVVELFYPAFNPHSAFDPKAGFWKDVPAKDVEVDELGVWLPGRLLNVTLVTCKGIEACLPLILLFIESVRGS